MGELVGHDGAPFLRRERDRSLSHRRLAQGLLSVMVVNVTPPNGVPGIAGGTSRAATDMAAAVRGVNHWGGAAARRGTSAGSPPPPLSHLRAEGVVVVKFFNECLLFACAVAFVLSTIAGVFG